MTTKNNDQLAASTIAFIMLRSGWPSDVVKDKLDLIAIENIDAEEIFLLFGNVLALPYSEENDAKVNKAFKVAGERILSLKKQSEKQN